MAKAKSSSAASRSKSKSGSSMRDLKPKLPKKETFTIRQLQREEFPQVSPLLDDMSEDIEVHKITSESSNQSPRMKSAPVIEPDDSEDEDIEMQIPDISDLIPKETIKVKFGKFVQLVANHDFDEVIESHADDEIIMSSNLLTELAGANDKREERKIPLVFLVGIAIGVVLTYIFFSQ